MNYKNIVTAKFLITLIIASGLFVSCKQEKATKEFKDEFLLNSPEVVAVEKKTNKLSENPETKDKKLQINQSLVNVSKWVVKDDSDAFKFVSLPFSFEQFYDDYVNEMTYPYYNVSFDLKGYLIKNDFEAESYECLLLPSPSLDKFSLILAFLIRGDSEYYILLSVTSDEVIDMNVIAETGDVNNLRTFDINNDYVINKYKGQRNNKVLLNKFKINTTGKIIKL